MSIFNQNGDPLWVQFFGGRKFLLAIICLGLAAGAYFCTPKMDAYQFGGILLTALGLYAYNNRKQKEVELSPNNSTSTAGSISAQPRTSQPTSEPALRK